MEEKLKEFNQTHLLNYINELTKEEREKFLKDLETIPFFKMKKLYQKSYEKTNIITEEIKPIKYFAKTKINKKQLETLGLSYIKNYALITLAGGSGTRLGHHAPKGTYELEINNTKISIFGLIAKQLNEIANNYKVNIPWYILTSKDNEEETKSFFTKQNFFNYPKEKITFFSQKSLPILDIHGNILLKNKKEILKGSNGNGEVFKALKYHNILTKMKNQNIKYIQICNIDNILCKAFDPIFVGLMKQNNFQIGSKTFIKDNDNEKEYVFCKYQNKPILLPYKIVYEKIKQNTEMSLSILDTFSGISIFTIEALEKLQNMKLPYHRAYKAYNYIDINGSQIDSKEKNAFKFEKYIFDAFFEFEDMLLYRVDKQTEFAPIKNKTGENSPETAIKQFEQLTKKDSY